MSATSPHDVELSFPFRVVGTVGLTSLVLTMCAVVMAIFPGLQTGSAAILAGKDALLGGLNTVTLVCAAIMLWSPASGRLRPVLLPALLLGGSVLWMALGMAASDAPGYAFREGFPLLTSIAAAATAPLLLRNDRHVRWMLLALAAAGIYVAVTCITAAGGYRGFNRLAYGVDPRDVVESAELQAKVGADALGGGLGRSPLRSSFGNPEYVGGFLVAAFLLGAVSAAQILLRGRERRVAAICWVLYSGVILVTLLLVQTRSAFIAIGIGTIAALLAPAPIRGLHIAGGLLATAAAGVFGGPKSAVIVFAAASIFLAAQLYRTGVLARVLGSFSTRARMVILAAPLLFGGLLVAYSVPGPWNPGGARLLPRLVQALGAQDDSTRERIIFYMIAGELATSHPVVGAGTGFYGPGFHPALASIAESDSSGVMEYARNRMRGGVAEFAHNDFFQIAAEQGFVGLALFLGAMVAILQALVRVIRSHPLTESGDALTLLTLICGVLAVGLFSGPLHFADRASVFWMTVGTALSFLAIHGSRVEEPRA